MRAEYCALWSMTLFFLLAWAPVSVGKYKAFGRKWLASNRSRIPGELPPWAARCERAYSNLKDYYPGFIVAVLMLGQLGKFDEGTAIAAWIYVGARISHYIVYGLGSVPARFLSYLTAMLSNLYLFIKIL